jgi:hypothetical protein
MAFTTKARFRFRRSGGFGFNFPQRSDQDHDQELSELSFLHNFENLLILGKARFEKLGCLNVNKDQKRLVASLRPIQWSSFLISGGSLK